MFVPYKKSIDKPALVVELKWNKAELHEERVISETYALGCKTVKGAIDQIKEKNYLSSLEAYQGDLLLVGINYEKDTKHHECVIESWEI